MKEKKITEDERGRRQHEMDLLTSQFIASVDAALGVKEKEILEI